MGEVVCLASRRKIVLDEEEASAAELESREESARMCASGEATKIVRYMLKGMSDKVPQLVNLMQVLNHYGPSLPEGVKYVIQDLEEILSDSDYYFD